MKPMNTHEALAVLSIIIFLLLTLGEPDIIDAVVYWIGGPTFNTPYAPCDALYPL